MDIRLRTIASTWLALCHGLCNFCLSWRSIFLEAQTAPIRYAERAAQVKRMFYLPKLRYACSIFWFIWNKKVHHFSQYFIFVLSRIYFIFISQNLEFFIFWICRFSSSLAFPFSTSKFWKSHCSFVFIFLVYGSIMAIIIFTNLTFRTSKFCKSDLGFVTNLYDFSYHCFIP